MCGSNFTSACSFFPSNWCESDMSSYAVHLYFSLPPRHIQADGVRTAFPWMGPPSVHRPFPAGGTWNISLVHQVLDGLFLSGPLRPFVVLCMCAVSPLECDLLSLLPPAFVAMLSPQRNTPHQSDVRTDCLQKYQHKRLALHEQQDM